jgi:hypothetical protein
MSFLNNIAGLLSQFSGAAPEQVQSAAADHVGGMDAGQLAGHLTDGAQNMNGGQLMQLASSLLGALGNHGHDETKLQDAGISTDDAQAGDQDAVTALISHAQQNPAALKDAAIDFIRNNPQAVQQFAPDFLKGILSKIDG